MKPSDIDVRKHRDWRPGTDPLFPSRWSPRAMSGEPIADDVFRDLLEAARWAPSFYNGQPWRFLYAKRDTGHWDTYLDLLVDFNRSWAKNAAVLVVVVSRNTYERNGKPARTHSYDTGAAWMSLALQGAMKGLVVHGMQGFDYDRAAEVLGVPDDHTVEAMAAIGRPGEIEDLPDTARTKESPSGRKELPEIAFEGGFPAD